jgi:flagellin
MSTINTNIQALTTAATLGMNQELQNNSIERLSSGSSILTPGDDPSGLAQSDSLSADNQKLGAASTNVQNALSYTQVAEGNLSVMSSIVDRMSELASESQDPTKNATDTGNYQIEFKSLQDQLRSMIGGDSSEIGGTTVSSPGGSFDGTTLFGSTAAGGVTMDVGDSASDQLTIPDINLQSGAMLGLIQQDSSGNYTLSATSASALSQVTAASQQVSDGSASLGAAQSRLGMVAAALTTEQQNNSSAISGITDVNVAQESTQLAKYNILVQSAAAMLAQANTLPESVLKLIHS